MYVPPIKYKVSRTAGWDSIRIRRYNIRTKVTLSDCARTFLRSVGWYLVVRPSIDSRYLALLASFVVYLMIRCEGITVCIINKVLILGKINPLFGIADLTPQLPKCDNHLVSFIKQGRWSIRSLHCQHFLTPLNQEQWSSANPYIVDDIFGFLRARESWDSVPTSYEPSEVRCAFVFFFFSPSRGQIFGLSAQRERYAHTVPTAHGVARLFARRHGAGERLSARQVEQKKPVRRSTCK